MQTMRAATRPLIRTPKKKFNPRSNDHTNPQSVANSRPSLKAENAEESTGENAAADAMKTARRIMALTKNLGLTKAMAGAATRIASLPGKAALQAIRIVSRAATTSSIAARSLARIVVNLANKPVQVARGIEAFSAHATSRPSNPPASHAQKMTGDRASIQPTPAIKRVEKKATSTAASAKPVRQLKKPANTMVQSAKKTANQPILSPFKTATPQPGMATIAIAAKKQKTSMIQAVNKTQASETQITGMRPK